MVETLLTVKQVKHKLQCSESFVYKMAEDGRLPAVRIPCPGSGSREKTLVRFKPSDVEVLVEQHYAGRAA